jgi:hypothetical protein
MIWVFGRGGVGYLIGYLIGNCTRVGVPYIYMYGRRFACGGEFFARSILFGSGDLVGADQIPETLRLNRANLPEKLC